MRSMARFSFFIFLFFSVGLAEAGSEIVVSSTGSNSDQDIINEAINAACENGGGVVYLTAGVYLVDGTIIMKSNIKLIGDPDAIIRVSSTSSQWFTGRTGVISCQESLKNVEIAGFQIDGNIKNLPSSFADSRSDTDHDCEKLIILGGYSNDFAENINIHHMKLYNSFSDGIFLIFTDHASCYDNIISNCQHEGIYFSVVKNGHIYNNKIAAITSDGGRLDNCDTCLVEYNLFFSYGGNSYGAYKNGASGLQIANAGSSHGYNAAKPDYPTRNIEVRFNTFADPGLKAVWLHGGENVFIHSNDFIDASGLETLGVPVGDISVDNQPTLEMSEQIFDDIFDILNLEYIDNALGLTQGTIIPVPEWKEKKKAAAYIYLAGYDGQITIDNHTYIPKNPWECARVSTGTRNLASKPAGQTSELKLSEGPNNGLHAKLKVKTEFKTKAKKSVTILGKTVSYNGTVTESKTETFEKDFPAPEVFPVVSEEDLNISVRYFNNTYNPHTTVTIEPKKGTVDVFRAITYKYNGSVATDEKYLGHVSRQENGFKTVNYEETTEWVSNDGLITYTYQGCFIPGPLDPAFLSVDIATPYDNFTITRFDVEEIRDPTTGIFRKLLILFTILVFLGMFAVSGFKMLIISFGGIRK